MVEGSNQINEEIRGKTENLIIMDEDAGFTNANNYASSPTEKNIEEQEKFMEEKEVAQDTPIENTNTEADKLKQQEAERIQKFYTFTKEVMEAKGSLPKHFGRQTLDGMVHTQYAMSNRKERRKILSRAKKQMKAFNKKQKLNKEIVENEVPSGSPE